MFVAYGDDSGTDRSSPFQIFAAVMMRAEYSFSYLEAQHALAIEQFIPEERRERFHEFHAQELFRGTGVFEDIKEDKRHGMLRELLIALAMAECDVFYGAVRKQDLHNTVCGSASPLDVAFRLCLRSIESWMQETAAGDLCILISDDMGDRAEKAQLKRSFRAMRTKHKLMEFGALAHFHDDIYFGDSKESVGIQLADTCAFFIGRQLRGEPDPKGFYSEFDGRIRRSELFSLTLR